MFSVYRIMDQPDGTQQRMVASRKNFLNDSSAAAMLNERKKIMVY